MKHLSPLIAIGLVLAGLACAVLPAGAADSTFVALEDHTEQKVHDAGPRQDWVERRDSIRFGRYSFVVTQRLDPATGLPPPQEKQAWGDTFVGIAGSKPADYMSSNWSPWDFLSARIRLNGDDKDLPNPARAGLLEYLTLRETSDTRIVGEAAWRDAAGGFLRARFVGWPGATRFGLVLRYFAPSGREVASVAYTLVCQPYDYSDRGHWERRRCVATATRTEELSNTPVTFHPDYDPVHFTRFVFFNQYAQNDAGTTLAVDTASTKSLAIAAEGNVIRIVIEPWSSAGRSAVGDVALLLGDWVDEAYPLARERFFADETVSRGLAETARRSDPRQPPWDASDVSEIDSLLRQCPTLEARFGTELREARRKAEFAACLLWTPGTPKVSQGPGWFYWSEWFVLEGPAEVADRVRADRRRCELQQELRAAWVREKQFRSGE